jgi:hypothetical protein
MPIQPAHAPRPCGPGLKVRSLRGLDTGGQDTGDGPMSRVLTAAGVAGLMLLGAVGCSHCCGSKTTSACAPNGCAPGTPMAATSSATPGTVTTTPGTVTSNGKPMTVQTMPVQNSPANPRSFPMSNTGAPMLNPQ